MMADTQWRDQVDAWDKAYRRKRKIIVLLILALIVVGMAGVAGFLLYPTDPPTTQEDLYTRMQYYDQGKARLPGSNPLPCGSAWPTGRCAVHRIWMWWAGSAPTAPAISATRL